MVGVYDVYQWHDEMYRFLVLCVWWLPHYRAQCVWQISFLIGLARGNCALFTTQRYITELYHSFHI